jgi:hypothetical protein
MKRCEYKVVTDHVEVRLVYFEPTPDEFERVRIRNTETEPYLLVGPPGGQLARIDGNDADILRVMLDRLFTGGMRAAPMGFGRLVPGPV